MNIISQLLCCTNNSSRNDAEIDVPLARMPNGVSKTKKFQRERLSLENPQDIPRNGMNEKECNQYNPIRNEELVNYETPDN